MGVKPLHLVKLLVLPKMKNAAMCPKVTVFNFQLFLIKSGAGGQSASYNVK